MLEICLLGTGGMMPLPYRWLTSMMARCNGSTLLIDSGEGTQIAIKEKGWSTKPIDTILFTHYHADHISGLPGLLLSMGNAERTEPVTLVGPRGLERVVNALRVIAPELPFELKFIELEENRQELDFEPFHVTAFRVNHGVTCYGYSLQIRRGGKFFPQKALDAGIPQKFWNPLQKGQTIVDGDKIYTPDMVLGPARKGMKVTYCTDTRPVPVIAEEAAGSDLFICEGMYGEPDKLAKAKEYKHMTMYEAANLAVKAQPKQMWLTHYSPSLAYPEDYIGAVRNIFPETIAAKDGRTIDLMFEED